MQHCNYVNWILILNSSVCVSEVKIQSVFTHVSYVVPLLFFSFYVPMCCATRAIKK